MLVVKFRTASFTVFPYVQVRIRDITCCLAKKEKKGRKTPKRTGPLGRTCSRAIVY